MRGRVRAEQFDARIQQERTKQIENPLDALDQNGTQSDHNAAHDERAKDSPKK